MTPHTRLFCGHDIALIADDNASAGSAQRRAWAWRQRRTTRAGLITRVQGALPSAVRLPRVRTSARQEPPGLPLFRARTQGAARCSRSPRGPRWVEVPESAPMRAAVFAVLAVVFDALHPLCDQWFQRPKDAKRKGLHGKHIVYVSDGECVGQVPHRSGAATASASSVGRRATTAHVATYGGGQITATIAVLRAMGLHVPWRALAAGAAINLSTHWILDRRDPLLWLAKHFNGKGGYVDYITVVRKPGESADRTGPGTGLFELDSAAHRAFGVIAAAVTALATVEGNSDGRI